MWVKKLQWELVKSSKWILVGAVMVLLSAGNLSGAGSPERAVSSYFIGVDLSLLLTVPVIATEVPLDVLILSKPVGRRNAFLQHALTTASFGLLLAGLGAIISLLGAWSPKETMRGFVISTLIVLTTQPIGFFVGLFLRGKFTRAILSIGIALGLFFLPLGLLITGNTGPLQALIIPTYGPVMSTINKMNLSEATAFALLSSCIWTLIPMMLFSRREICYSP